MSKNFESTDAAKLSAFFAFTTFASYLFYRLFNDIEQLVILFIGCSFLVIVVISTIGFFIAFVILKIKEKAKN